MTLALHLAKSERESALVLLGLTPEVADLLAHRGIHEIELLTELGCRLLRPRWADQPAVWRHLLAVEGTEPVVSGRAFVLHALQLSNGKYSSHSQPRKRRHLLR